MLSHSSGLTKLQEGVSLKLEENRQRGEKMREHRKEYLKLDERLSTLSDRLTHNVMVPFTSKAFMPGSLIHTNEILVLLGENYFVETSSKHAREICSRRIKQCDKVLEELKKELELVQGWKQQTRQLQQEGEQCLDITEEMSDAQLKDWRIQHKESVKREREKTREAEEKSAKSQSDDDLWKRLEELEVREALEREWELDGDDEDDDDNDVEDSDEDDDDVDDDISDNDDISNNVGSDIDNKKHADRRISFAEEPIMQEIPTIRFTHSDCEAERTSISAIYPVHPGDINADTSCTGRPAAPKSILKMSADFNPADYIKPDPSPPAVVASSTEPFSDPVSAVVRESTVISPTSPTTESSQFSETTTTTTTATTTSTKRVSRFKAMRSQK